MIDPTQAAPDLSGLVGGPPPPSVSSPQNGDPSDTLRHIIDLWNVYLQEEIDDQDLAVASDLQARTQKLLADQQKQVDQATGAGPTARVIRRAAAQGGGY
jgi:hypothetical protein